MNDLVKGLRGELLDCKCNAYCYGECCCDTTWPESLCREAADEIEMQEALLREIDRELDDVEYLGSYVDGIKALKAEIEQLKSQLKEKKMTTPNTIKINDVTYIREDAVQPKTNGNRAVVVVDRGWIFAGDVTRENGRIKLSRALHVFEWVKIGFAKMVETANADLRPISDLDIPEDAEIFCIPVPENWGLK